MPLSIKQKVYGVVITTRHINKYTSSLWYQPAGDVGIYETFSNYSTYGAISGNTWHTVNLWWTDTDIKIYLDGVFIKGIINNKIKADSMCPMNLIVDINGPAGGFCRIFDPINDSFPYKYEVEYVKVWQLKPKCTTAVSYCSSFNPTTFNNSNGLYQSVTIGGTGCSDPITATNFVGIYGKDYVQIAEGFSIDGSSTVVLDVQQCPTGKVYSPMVVQPPPSSWSQRNFQH